MTSSVNAAVRIVARIEPLRPRTTRPASAGRMALAFRSTRTPNTFHVNGPAIAVEYATTNRIDAVATNANSSHGRAAIADSRDGVRFHRAMHAFHRSNQTVAARPTPSASGGTNG